MTVEPSYGHEVSGFRMTVEPSYGRERVNDPRTNISGLQTHLRLMHMMPGRGEVPCQSSLNRQELKVCLPRLVDTDAHNCHRSSKLCIAHMMSTVLSVYTRPVKTDSKTRAGVHNDVSSPSVAQQSDHPGSWKESEVQCQPPNGQKSGRRKAKQKY